jgi:hypothetical protein
MVPAPVKSSGPAPPPPNTDKYHHGEHFSYLNLKPRFFRKANTVPSSRIYTVHYLYLCKINRGMEERII